MTIFSPSFLLSTSMVISRMISKPHLVFPISRHSCALVYLASPMPFCWHRRVSSK
jgi:hypothetical protein